MLGFGEGYSGKNKSDELAKVERIILELEQLLEVGPERETADLAFLEYWKVRATQIRDKESIEKPFSMKNTTFGSGGGILMDGKVSPLTPHGREMCQKMVDHPMGQVLIKAFELCLKKNKDYATQEDIFANFRETEDMGSRPSRGVAHRLSDKWMRFKKGVRTNWDMEVKGENMEDTILDIINYVSIYHCLYIQECVDQDARKPTEAGTGF